MHPAICGQVIKKKDAPCLGPNVFAGNDPRWCLKDTPTAAIFFCCKGTDQHVRIRSKIPLRATVQDGVSGLDKQLQLFCCSFLLSKWRFKANFRPVCKIIRYKDGGLPGKFFSICLEFLGKNTRVSPAQG